MKKFLKLLGKGLLVVCSMILCTTQTTFAAEDTGTKDSYTYTVTFLAGNQGTFQGTGNVQTFSAGAAISGNGNQIQITGLKYGDEIIVDAAGSGMVNLADNNKYYVRGIRKSGFDNSAVGTQRFLVEADTEYVVAYGIKGNMVAYTVNYQDESGNGLMESRTYYGNVGDKPVVAYQYIENYQPQAYNLTKTLSQNGAENVFTFTYRQVAVTEGTPGTDNPTGTTTAPGAAGTPGTTTAGTTGAATAQGAGQTTGTEADNAASGEPGTNNETDGTVTVEQGETPQDLIELDDEEVPKSSMKDETQRDAEKTQKRNYTVMYSIVAVVALAALTSLVLALRKKRKS